MIPRDAVIARLREANFTFEDRAKHTEIYRQKGGPQHVAVRLRDDLEDDEACAILQQAGLTKAQLEAFLASCVKH